MRGATSLAATPAKAMVQTTRVKPMAHQPSNLWVVKGV